MTLAQRSIATVAVLALVTTGIPAAENNDQTEQLAKRFKISAEDAGVFATTLEAVRDETTQWQETALRLLLGHVSKMDRVTDAEMDALDQPAFKNLLDEPARYRCRQVRMKVRVYSVLKMTSGKEMESGVGWPLGKVLWRLKCTTAEPKPINENSMMILSLVEPPPLGKPSKETDDGELLYEAGPELDTACVFYKVYRDKTRLGGVARNYPLLVAWTVKPLSGGPDNAGSSVLLVFAAVGVVVLALGYHMLRKRVKGMRKKEVVHYGSMRDVPQEPQADETPDGDEDDSVDPLLKQAAEQYQQERRACDGTNSQS